MDKSDFQVYSLREILDEAGEEGFKRFVSGFYCEKNLDVTSFLHDKAVAFEKADYDSSRTYLVGFESDDGFCLCGYFTLNNKPFVRTEEISKSKWKNITDGRTKKSAVSSVLIGQLGKNSNMGLGNLISGTDLLYLALQKIGEVYKSIGIDLVHLECKPEKKLQDFYERNGFTLCLNRNGTPVFFGKNSDLLCYVAKYRDLILM